MITGKLILKGTIKLISPCLIGSGKSEYTDIDLIKDSNGVPFIPATSFLGVLRHYIKVNDNNEKLKRFWGSIEGERDYLQSSIYCKDLYIKDTNDFKIYFRDGIAIDNTKGIAKKNSKFDYEILEPGNLFELNIEIDLYNNCEDFFKRMLSTILDHLKNGDIRVGAKTNNGFGKVTIEDFKIYHFDFGNKKHLLKWLKQDFSCDLEAMLPEPFKINERRFKIIAKLKLKNSLIVRSYTGNPSELDAVHIKSGNNSVLPGTSLKGAIRARAEKILNTIKKDENITKKFIDDLFGFVSEDREKHSECKAKKGRIMINETILPEYPSEVQTRIKIDRFTGGVMQGALVESMPLFSETKDDKVIEINIEILDYKNYEAGLLLLILKDLWTGDLAVGGEKSIGRGVFEGIEAVILNGEKEIKISKDLKVIPENETKYLESLVCELANNNGGIK